MNNDGFFHDRELVRRIRVSQLAVYVIVIAASIWAMILLLAGDLGGTIISATVTAAYGLCLFLFFKQKQTPARLLWLLNGSVALLGRDHFCTARCTCRIVIFTFNVFAFFVFFLAVGKASFMRICGITTFHLGIDRLS